MRPQVSWQAKTKLGDLNPESRAVESGAQPGNHLTTAQDLLSISPTPTPTYCILHLG